MDGYVAFHALLRHFYNCLIKDLGKQCKQMVRHHLVSVTSPYSQVCYENDYFRNFGSAVNTYYQFSGASGDSFSLELADGAPSSRSDCRKDQENVPPEKDAQATTPGNVSINSDNLKGQNIGRLLFGNSDIVSSSTSAYSEVCSSAAQHFALVERGVSLILNSGFLTP